MATARFLATCVCLNFAWAADQNENCATWAAAGECTRNAAYMLKACSASCSSSKDASKCREWAAAGQCGKNAAFMMKECASFCPSQRGEMEECEQWARMGECDQNPDFMLQKCASTCGSLLKQGSKKADATQGAEKAEALLQKARKEMEELQKRLSEKNKVALQEAERQHEERLRKLDFAKTVAEQRELQLQQALEASKARVAILEEQLAGLKRAEADAPRCPVPSTGAPGTTRKSLAAVYGEPRYPLVVPEENETACEKALQSLCAGNLDGQQPPLSQVLQACQHSEDVTQLKQELASKPAELAEPCPSQPERSGGKKLDEDDELLIFFSGAVRCEGNCSSGLMLSSLRATLQQSFQLLLDGFLLALNTALGADPEKGRAAAARAAQIGRRLRQRLGELMEAKGADLEKVLEMSPHASELLQRFSHHAATKTEHAAATAGRAAERLMALLPAEHRRIWPSDSQWQELSLVFVWLLLLLFVSVRILSLTTKLAIKLFVVLPRQLLTASCRCCLRCLCPCERKKARKSEKG